MAYFLSPILNEQLFDANGVPLNGGKIQTYLAGTTTPVITFKTSAGTAHSNPITLDSTGNMPTGTQLWLEGGKQYKFVVMDSDLNVIRTIDNITGINDTNLSPSEWTQYTATAFTYLSATSFSVVGDQTNIFQVNRRVQTMNTGGLAYGTVVSAVYGAPNTAVTLTNTSGALDSGLSAVYYSLLSATNDAVPATYAKLTSPSFSGVPTTPTAADATNTTQIASTAFVIANSAPVVAAFSQLTLSATGLSALVTITANELAVQSTGLGYRTLRTVSVTPSLAASGANGLDTGVSAASTWYSVWVIWNGTTTAGLLSLSATAPTMPSGYTHKARVGWVRSDASGNKYPLKFIQTGRKTQYVVTAATNVLALPLVSSGAVGTYSATVPTWGAISVSNFVPPTAARILLAIHNAYNSASPSTLIAAPNNAYSGNQTTNPPPCLMGSGTGISTVYDWALESTNVYAATGAAFGMQCLGWEDNL